MPESQSSGEECMRGTASESSGNSTRGNEAPRSVATAGMSDEQLARMLTRKRIRWGSCFCWHSTHDNLQGALKHLASVLSLPDSDLLSHGAGEGEALGHAWTRQAHSLTPALLQVCYYLYLSLCSSPHISGKASLSDIIAADLLSVCYHNNQACHCVPK